MLHKVKAYRNQVQRLRKAAWYTGRIFWKNSADLLPICKKQIVQDFFISISLLYSKTGIISKEHK
jgi:hypothetical protein